MVEEAVRTLFVAAIVAGLWAYLLRAARARTVVRWRIGRLVVAAHVAVAVLLGVRFAVEPSYRLDPSFGVSETWLAIELAAYMAGVCIVGVARDGRTGVAARLRAYLTF